MLRYIILLKKDASMISQLDCTVVLPDCTLLDYKENIIQPFHLVTDFNFKLCVHILEQNFSALTTTTYISLIV